jgi:hypothetical protein
MLLKTKVVSYGTRTSDRNWNKRQLDELQALIPLGFQSGEHEKKDVKKTTSEARMSFRISEQVFCIQESY